MTKPSTGRLYGRTVLQATVLLIAGLLVHMEALQQDSGVSIKFVARGTQIPVVAPPPNGVPGETSLFGHVFMIMSTRTNQGVKEDVFSFSPRGDGKALIKGPGMLRAEYRCRTSDDCDPRKYDEIIRMHEVVTSAELPITTLQRSEVFRVIEQWNSKDYSLTSQNCVNFVKSVLEPLGVDVPAWPPSATPVQFVRTLQSRVADELGRRQATADADRRQRVRQDEARRLEAEQEEIARLARLREETERKRREEAERQRAANEAEARRIPDGWVLCTCPDQHRNMGKTVDGRVYHDASLRCR